MVVVNVPGYVKAQPEVVYVGNKPVIKVKVVDKQRRKNRDSGQWESVFLDFVFECWENDALYHAEKLTKGRNVIAVGTNPKKEEWTGPNGEKRECLVYELVSVGYPYQERQQSSEGEAQAPQGRPAPSQHASPAPRYAKRPVSVAQNAAEPKPRMSTTAEQQHAPRHEPNVSEQTTNGENQSGSRNSRVSY